MVAIQYNYYILTHGISGKHLFTDQHNYVAGPAKLHVSAKIANFLSLLYHNLISIYMTTTKSSSLLQNLMGFLLQLMEMEYILHSKWKILAKI